MGDSVSFGLGDEIHGGFAGVDALLQGRDYGTAFRRQRDRSRATLERAWRERALETGVGTLAGAVVPFAGIGAGVRTGVSLGGRLLRAAGSGVAAGAVSGAGAVNTTADTLGGDIQQRLGAAGQGGVIGAVLGGGAHGIGQLARVPRAITTRLGRIPASSAGSMPESILNDIFRTARQNPNLNMRAPDDLLRIFREAAVKNPGATVAEALGSAGTQRLAALARMPGETGELVEGVITQRNRNAAGKIETRFLRAPVSGDDLEVAVKQAWKTDGARLYNPILNAPLSRANLRAFVDLRKSPLWNHRAVRSAWERSAGAIDDRVALGELAEGARSSLKHRLHYTKVSLSDMVSDPRKLDPGLAAMDNANLTAATHQFANVVDGIIPGYNLARATLADHGAAKRAIEVGRTVFSLTNFRTGDALRRHMVKLTPGELPYFIAGMEDAIGNMIQSAGRDGRRNVASALLNDRFQARLKIVLGGQKANAMLRRARQSAALFDTGNRMRPSTGSITSNMAFQAADMLSMPTKSGIIDHIGQSIWNNTLGRFGEKYRNAAGRIYASPANQQAAVRALRTGLLGRATRVQAQRLRQTKGAYQAGLWGVGANELSGLFGGDEPQ